MAYRLKIRILTAASIALLAGCETYSGATTEAPALSSDYARTVALSPCKDTSGVTIARDLGAEATAALRKRLAGSAVFRLSDDPALALKCDVEGFAEGSAFKRWIMPGWGATNARIKLAVWSVAEGEIIATFQSKAQVSSGGLYTIGADRYILDVAADDVLEQMETWATGG